MRWRCFREFICTQSWVSLMLAQLFSPYLTNSGNPRYQWVSLSVVVWVLLTEKDINFLIVWVVLPLHPWCRDECGLCENTIKRFILKKKSVYSVARTEKNPKKQNRKLATSNLNQSIITLQWGEEWTRQTFKSNIFWLYDTNVLNYSSFPPL